MEGGPDEAAKAEGTVDEDGEKLRVSQLVRIRVSCKAGGR